MASDNKSGLLRIIEAAGKRKEQELRIKNEILKMRARQKMGDESHAKRQEMKRQAASADQSYLRRRLHEESPLSQLIIPEDGAEDASVSFPSTKVDQTSRGTLQERPITPREQAGMFITKYNKMLEAGKKPHPAMAAVYEKMFQKVNGKPAAEKTSSAYKPNKQTQEVLDQMAELVDSGEVKSIEEIHARIDKKTPAYRMQGVNVDYVKGAAFQTGLPEKFVDKKGVLGSEIMAKPDLKKVHDSWYKKTKEGWIPADPEDYADQEEDEEDDA